MCIRDSVKEEHFNTIAFSDLYTALTAAKSPTIELSSCLWLFSDIQLFLKHFDRWTVSYKRNRSRLQSKGCTARWFSFKVNSLQKCLFILWLSVIDPITMPPAFSTMIAAFLPQSNWNAADIRCTGVTETRTTAETFHHNTNHQCCFAISWSFAAIPFKHPPP